MSREGCGNEKEERKEKETWWMERRDGEKKEVRKERRANEEIGIKT